MANFKGVIGAASSELFSRTADEMFYDLNSLHDYNVSKRANSRQAKVNLAELTIDVDTEQRQIETTNEVGDKAIETLTLTKPVIRLPSGDVAHFTNFSFGQLSQSIGIPPRVSNKLPAELVAQVFNHGLRNGSITNTADLENPWEIDVIHGSKAVESNASLLFRVNGHTTLDAISGPNYGRFFDAQLSEFAVMVSEKYSLNPLPASPINGSRGLYSSDRSCFIGLVDNTRRVFEKAENGGLSRMLLLANSEVNARPLWFLGGFYSYICANHNFWDSETVFEVSLRHTRNIVSRFDIEEICSKVKRFFEASPEQEEKFITACQTKMLGATKQETIDELLRLRNPLLGKRASTSIVELAEKRESRYGSPYSVWAVANAITETAQDSPYYDVRSNMQQAAKMVFNLAK